MDNVSFKLMLIFILITLATVFQFYKASNYSKRFLILISIWSTIQLFIGLSDFYVDGFLSFPPKIALLLFPPLIVIFLLLLSKKGNQFIDRLNIKDLILIHTVRIPV